MSPHSISSRRRDRAVRRRTDDDRHRDNGDRAMSSAVFTETQQVMTIVLCARCGSSNVGFIYRFYYSSSVFLGALRVLLSGTDF